MLNLGVTTVLKVLPFDGKDEHDWKDKDHGKHGRKDDDCEPDDKGKDHGWKGKDRDDHDDKHGRKDDHDGKGKDHDDHGGKHARKDDHDGKGKDHDGKDKDHDGKHARKDDDCDPCDGKGKDHDGHGKYAHNGNDCDDSEGCDLHAVLASIPDVCTLLDCAVAHLDSTPTAFETASFDAADTDLA
jgi:hypothetical protein